MGIKVPNDLSKLKAGKLVDMLYELRQERKLIELDADAIKTNEKRIEDYLLDNMSKQELSKLSGELANVSVKRSIVPQVTDWDKLYAYVKKHGAFDLLQRRAGTEAFRVRWEQGVEIPGVDRFTQIGLSVTKAATKGE